MAASRAEKQELRLRALSSIGVVVVIIGAIYLGRYAWTLVAGVIALSSLNEYYKILNRKAERKAARVSPGIGYVFSVLFLFAASMDKPQPIVLAMVLSLCVCAVFVAEIVRRQLTKGESYALTSAGAIISGVLYITVPWTCMIVLHDYYVGRQILCTLFFCTWACDVGAYIGGKLFGTVKLCQYVSPGKTVQGFIAGVIASLLVNALCLYIFSLPENPMMCIGFICGIFGQVGDLAESLLKREAEIKDSGSIIPGHGGMLDRFDSILFNGLLTYLMLRVLL